MPSVRRAGASGHRQHQKGSLELPGPDPSGDSAPHYEITGTVEWGQDPSSVLLSVGGFQLLAEPITIRQVPGTSHETYALERFSPGFFVPSIGTRATITCRLEVMADYETDDAFGYPERLRRDWAVRHLKVQRHALIAVPGREGTWNVGKVVGVDTIERMHRWADEQRHHPITYLFDLQLPT